MSIAPREAKCLRSWNCWPGQPTRFGQRVKTAPSSLTVGVSHDGQRSGGRGGAARSLRSTACGAGESTCGITSPARRTMTSSPDAEVLACDVLLVVERRELHRDAAEMDRLEDGERVEVAELADVPRDVPEQRDRGGRRELPRDRPARVAPDDAEPALQLDVVDLHDAAVDLEVERAAPLLHALHWATTSSSASRRLMSRLTRKSCARSHSSASQWVENATPSVAPTP